MKKLLITALIIFSLVTSAGASELWIVLLDLSKSVGEPTRGTPLWKNLADIDNVIRSAGKETTIFVIGFGKKTEAQLVRAVMPKQAGPREKFLSATREAAVAKLRQNLGNRLENVDRSATDCHGALLRAERILEETKDGDGKTMPVRKLFIYSDMLDNQSFGLSLRALSAMTQEESAKRLNKSVGIPDLRGVDVYCRSAIVDSGEVNTRQFEIAVKNLKAFWAQYFQKTNGRLVEYKTLY
ncbi:MAG: hypothetical protein A4E57_00767 [Syntrophorhabdaceae bacterium PtaU1.Bin034]|nr:MAG: hypothetical protein A4E57_00767 [Syntrophorhabdaceae bacterium PtaU1.Bin034]